MKEIAFLLLLVPLPCRGANKYYTYDPSGCDSCYADGGQHCINQYFTEGRCCKYDPSTERSNHDLCVADYYMCTSNVDQYIYYRLTCVPDPACPVFETVYLE